VQLYIYDASSYHCINNFSKHFQLQVTALHVACSVLHVSSHLSHFMAKTGVCIQTRPQSWGFVMKQVYIQNITTAERQHIRMILLVHTNLLTEYWAMYSHWATALGSWYEMGLTAKYHTQRQTAWFTLIPWVTEGFGSYNRPQLWDLDKKWF
jgi:hypothetical protein